MTLEREQQPHTPPAPVAKRGHLQSWFCRRRALIWLFAWNFRVLRATDDADLATRLDDDRFFASIVSELRERSQDYVRAALLLLALVVTAGGFIGRLARSNVGWAVFGGLCALGAFVFLLMTILEHSQKSFWQDADRVRSLSYEERALVRRRRFFTVAIFAFAFLGVAVAILAFETVVPAQGSRSMK